MVDKTKDKAITLFISAIAWPIMLLNSVGAIIIAILLIIEHKYGAVGIGVAYGLIGADVLALVLAPGYGISKLAIRSFDRGHRSTSMTLFLVAWLYNVFIVTISVIAVVLILTGSLNGATRILQSLWIYVVAVWPWIYMAYYEIANHPITGEYNATVTLAYFLCLGLLVTGILGYTTNNALLAVGAYLVLMAIFLLIQMVALRNMLNDGFESESLISQGKFTKIKSPRRNVKSV